MNVTKKMLIGGAVITVAVLVSVLLRKNGSDTEIPLLDASPVERRTRTAEAMPEKQGAPENTQAVSRPEPPPDGENETQETAAKQTKVLTGVNAAEEAISEERIKVIEAWEDFVDKVAEYEGKPTSARALQLKREFDKLDKADQLDGIQTSLNLLPDEQFPLLYPILFDKTVDPDILDAIFSDGLNHDEEIKIPMMKEIYKDKTHPMWEEAERILDATGELDNDDPEPDEPDGDE